MGGRLTGCQVEILKGRRVDGLMGRLIERITGRRVDVLNGQLESVQKHPSMNYLGKYKINQAFFLHIVLFFV